MYLRWWVKMDASDQAIILANATSEGIRYLAYIRSLQGEPHVAMSEEILEWCKVLDDYIKIEKAFQDGHIGGYVLVGSPPASGDLVRCIENVRAHLSTITPGAGLPASLFDLIDVAWAEIFKTMHAS
ncbi:MAG: hypothetical protein ACMG6S_14365 [Byssovorax sp.]